MDAGGPARVAAIVLAAGASARMGGSNKLLAVLHGVPIVRRVVDGLRDLPLADRVVVTGADAGAVRRAIGDAGVRFVHNAAHEEGIASSIRAGIAALPADTDAALIALGDMPFVLPSDVALLIAAFEAGHGICIPVHDGRRGNPVLWAARYFPELLRLTGDTGARRLFDRFATDVREVAVGGPGVLVDVDTPEALRAARAEGADRDPGRAGPDGTPAG